MNPFQPEQLAALRARFKEPGGSTVQDFVNEHGLSYPTTMAVIKGRCYGLRGEGFKAAVALGLRKAPPKKRTRAISALPTSQQTV